MAQVLVIRRGDVEIALDLWGTIFLFRRQFICYRTTVSLSSLRFLSHNEGQEIQLPSDTFFHVLNMNPSRKWDPAALHT